MPRASSLPAPPRNGTDTRVAFCDTSSGTALPWLAWSGCWSSCRPTFIRSRSSSFIDELARTRDCGREECAFPFCELRTILLLVGTMDAKLLDEFRTIVGERGLVSSDEGLHTYECDGLTNFRVMPLAVLLPSTTEQVQAIVRICHREKIPFVARGSGTGLSGGALPVNNGIVISLARMNRILEVDLPNARVVVEPGVINLDVTGRVQSQGYFYAPDPSSQSVCSIGGNVAENSGGAHCLKYGFTTTH